MDSNRKARLIALIITIIIAIICVLLMLWFSLTFKENEPRKWPPEDTAELLFEGEYVKLGDIPDLNQEDSFSENSMAEENVNEGFEPENSGIPAEEPAPVVSSSNDSPVKVVEKTKPEQTGPTEAEIAERERLKQQQEDQKKSENAKNRTINAFSNNSNNSSGQTGSPDGNANTGSDSTIPGIGEVSLSGRRVVSPAKPSADNTGKIVIKIWVDRNGNVKKAEKTLRREGPVGGDERVINSCIEAAYKYTFDKKADAPELQEGTITFIFN